MASLSYTLANQLTIDLTRWQMEHLSDKLAAFQFANINHTSVTSWMGIVDQRDWDNTLRAFPPCPFSCWSVMVGL